MIKKIFSLLILFAVLLSVVSCGKAATDNNDAKFVEDIPLPQYKSGQTITLNVYNWGEYISDGSEGTLDVNKAFEEYFNSNLSSKYGGIKIKVEYSTYATNEDMYSKLKNSAVSYDIIIPSDYMIQKMKDENMLLGFDTSTLSNYGNIDAGFKNTYYDPDNSFSVPYTYGMVGIIYDKEKVAAEDAEKQSWGLMWNEKYSGNILQFNNPRDAFASAMYWKGFDVNSVDPDVWDEAFELLKKQKPILQGYVNDEIFNKMQSRSAAIAAYYVGDFLTMAEAQYEAREEIYLDFYFPKEGTNYFIDAMCIPTCSENPHLAKEYINFMLSEEPAVANAQYIGYASPNNAVINNEEYIASMRDYSYESADGKDAYDLLYENTPDVVNKNYDKLFKDINQPACYRSFDTDTQAHVNTLWEKLKIEGSTELWVHILSIAIVALVSAFLIYSIYTKKKRSRHYRKH